MTGWLNSTLFKSYLSQGDGTLRPFDRRTLNWIRPNAWLIKLNVVEQTYDIGAMETHSVSGVVSIERPNSINA